MLLATNVAIVFHRGLEEFQPPISGIRLASVAQFLHRRRREWLKSPSDLEVLLQHNQRVHTADRRADWQAHRIVQRLGGGDRAPLQHLSAAAKTLHPERRD